MTGSNVDSAKYIRKPFYIDAVRVTPENIDQVKVWCNGEIRTGYGPNGEVSDIFIKVNVKHPMSERQTKAYFGDWVLYAGTGYKVYKDKAFRQSFTQVDAEPDEEIKNVFEQVDAETVKIVQDLVDEANTKS